jgi:hypothetical protein
MDGPNGKPIKSLPALAAAESECHRCLLYRDATQAVPGEGPAKADFMLVGEQPGDKEDLAGKPGRPHSRLRAQRRRHRPRGHLRHQCSQAFQT